jgi:prolyl-tRNA editing enzyme YbaK/EbsC (Cys-tRNA(Pro) deacylase)
MEMYHRIIAALEAANVSFEKFEHSHVHSSHDAATVRGTKIEEAAKAIVLQTGSGKLVQCIVSGHKKIDLKKLKVILAEKNISLAHPDVVFSATGCKVGSVPPFGNLFAPPMPVYADENIFSRSHVVFSAGSHYHSIRMEANAWASVVKPIVVNVATDI